MTYNTANVKCTDCLPVIHGSESQGPRVGIVISDYWCLSLLVRDDHIIAVHAAIFMMLVILLIVVSIPCILSLRRIGIIGSGPAGLSLAACLKQLRSGCEEVIVFESRSDFLQARLGGGVQLTGGAKILEQIGLLPQINEIAQPLRRVYSRNADEKVLLDLNVAELVKSRASVELCDANDRSKPLVFSIMRDALQKVLYDATQAILPVEHTEETNISVKIETNKKLVSIDEYNEDEEGVSLTFEDGSTAKDFDVVFVANGVRSFPTSSDISDAQKYEGLEDNYTGIRITYAVSEVDDSFSLRPNGTNTFEQYFGDGCYVLSGSYGGLDGVQHMLAVVYKDDQDATQGINENWQNDEYSMKAQIKQRLIRSGLSHRYDSLIALLDACPNDRFFDLGVRDNTVNTLKTPWASSTGRTIFLGDSAHAMPPFLGQGANQALQDAYVLAQGVKKINQCALPENQQIYSRETQKLQDLALSYQVKRKLFTAQLGLKARILGVIETLGGFVGQLFRDSFFQVMAKVGIVSYVFLDGAKPRI